MERQRLSRPLKNVDSRKRFSRFCTNKRLNNRFLCKRSAYRVSWVRYAIGRECVSLRFGLLRLYGFSHFLSSYRSSYSGSRCLWHCQDGIGQDACLLIASVATHFGATASGTKRVGSHWIDPCSGAGTGRPDSYRLQDVCQAVGTQVSIYTP